MFTVEHYIWIGICAAFVLILSYLSLHFHFSFRQNALIMAAIAFLSEGSKIISHMEPVNKKDPLEGMVLSPEALPLHLCSLLIFAFFYLPFAKEGRGKNFILGITVPVGIVGSLLAILMATSGTDFLEATSYQCFLYHAGIMWFAITLIATKQVDLGKKTYQTNLCFLFCMAIAMLWVNSALSEYDTNFWYVVRPPVEGLPLLNLKHGWFVYFATLLVAGFLGVSAVHLPFLLAEKKKRGLASARG